MESDGIRPPILSENHLFTEDLVTYVLNDLFRVPYRWPYDTERNRGAFHSAFTSTVREAVSLMHEDIELYINNNLHGNNNPVTWNLDTYCTIMQQLHDFHFDEGFEARNFLVYCIELLAAAREFKNKGVPFVVDIAVGKIFTSLQNYDTSSGVWETLNNTAADIVYKYNQLDGILTPSSYASMTSESESSESSESDNHVDGTPPQNADNAFSEKCQEEPNLQISGSEFCSSANEFNSDEIISLSRSSDESSTPASTYEVEEHDENSETKDNFSLSEQVDHKYLRESFMTVQNESSQSFLHFQSEIEVKESSKDHEANVNGKLIPVSCSSTKSENGLPICSVGALGMRNVAENNCTLVTSKDCPKASTSYQSLSSLSLPSPDEASNSETRKS